MSDSAIFDHTFGRIFSKRKKITVAEETLVVDDHDYLVALRLVIGASFGVGVMISVTTRWCVDNFPPQVSRLGVLNRMWPPMRMEIQKVHSVRVFRS